MTSTPGSASAVPGRLVRDAMGVRRVIGAFPAADPATVTDMPTTVTREAESASTAGITPAGTVVTGGFPEYVWLKLYCNELNETLNYAMQ